MARGKIMPGKVGGGGSAQSVIETWRSPAASAPAPATRRHPDGSARRPMAATSTAAGKMGSV